MPTAELEIPFEYPITYMRGRGRTQHTVLLRDSIRVGVPILTEDEAPLVTRYEDKRLMRSYRLEWRLVQGHMVKPTSPITGRTSPTVVTLATEIAEDDDYYGRFDFPRNDNKVLQALFGVYFEDRVLRPEFFGKKLPFVDVFPHNASTIIENGHDATFERMRDACSGLVAIGPNKEIYSRTQTPAAIIAVHWDRWSRGFDPDPDYVWRPWRMARHGFMFASSRRDAQTEFLSTVEANIHDTVRGRFESRDTREPIKILSHDAALQPAIEEACPNAAYAVSWFLSENGKALARMNVAGGEAIANLIRLRTLAASGDRAAPALIAASFAALREAGGHLAVENKVVSRNICALCTIAEKAIAVSQLTPQPVLRAADPLSI